jgi:putative restriction endonuclease
MLTPTVDHLFDKGFISFSDDGHLILSRLFSDGDVSRLNLDIEIAAVAFSAEQVDFLTYHRNRIFKA